MAPRPKTDRCEICGNLAKVTYDHDHKTDIFRGWLCGNCNAALGLVHDDTQILKKMIKYLDTITAI